MLTCAALVLLVSELAVAAAQAAGCHAAPDCNTCISGSQCGWCAVNTTFPTQVGPQCVSLHEVFDCNVQFQTDKCVQGWKCGGTNSSQCVPSVGGIASKAECEKSCAKPPKPPPPPPPSPPKQAYKCDETTFQCAKAKFGEPSMQTCQQKCRLSYQCDATAEMCKQVNVSAPGKKYYNRTACDAECPPKPTPTPYEIRGLWRGLRIDQSYTTGEWVANITADTLSIWYPDAGAGRYALYMSGAVSAIGTAKSGTYVMRVNSGAGKLQGAIRMLAADFSMDPEVYNFLQLAVDEANVGQEVADFDTGMASATVLSFETCPEGGTPPPPPPPPPGPPPPPPPCKAKLDVVVVLDGSASIVPDDWQRALAFTNKLIDGFNISADEVNLGVVQFSESASTVIGLSADKGAIHTAVTSLRQMRENTNTFAGFQTAKSILDTEGRPAAKGKLVILLTDGKQNRGQPASIESDALKAEGAQVFGIGVGSGVDVSEIESWVTAPAASHYFAVSAFDQLEKILAKIIESACPHPPSSPQMRAPLAGKSCRFHLPANTTAHRRLGLATVRAAPSIFGTAAPLAVSPAPVDAGNGSDSCNAFSTCSTCIGAHVSGKTCGWCTGEVHYGPITSAYKCAGKDDGSSSAKFTCTGHYQTTSCDEPGDCGLEGVYRGLRIDNGYEFGEWAATFTTANGSASEHARIVSYDINGKETAAVEGKLQCTQKCKASSGFKGSNFTLTTSAGQIIHGICGYTDQVQAETTGLMWALSAQGVPTPPPDFDTAMNSTNATVYTYYRCSEYKKGICEFKPPA
jgi:hypothetical protein